MVVTNSALPVATDVCDDRNVLRKYALRLAGNESDADDLVQDTYVRALTKRDSLDAGNKQLSWMMSILHNLFIDLCRRRNAELKTRNAITSLPKSPMQQLLLPPPPPPRWATVTQDEINAALVQISAKLRQVYELKAQGLSYREISHQLGIPTNTVGTRLRRAREALKSILSRDQEES
ncbi:MAG: RNA polymerase sigma factor [Myxococcota bacterium]